MKRGHYTTEAVVLDAINYGESDVILTLYTSQYGKLKAIAKGGRRSKRRFVGALGPASLVRVNFFRSDKSELVRLEEARLLDGFDGIKTDIVRVSAASYFLELVNEMTREGEVSTGPFELLKSAIGMLNEGLPTERACRFFEIRFLSMLGYMPELSCCVVCTGKPAVKEKVKFSSRRGGLVCGACAAGLTGLVPVTLGTAGFLRTASRLDLGKLSRLVPNAVFIGEAETMLSDFILHLMGKELKTKKFMRSIAVASA